jgi:hypothetical protein
MEKSNIWLKWGHEDEVDDRGRLDNSLIKEIIKDTGQAIAQGVAGAISNPFSVGGGGTSENLIIPGPALVFFVHQYISIKLSKKLNLLTSPLMNGKLLDILKNYKVNIGEVDRLNSLIYLLENKFLVYRGEIKIKIENKKEKSGETWKCEVSVSEEKTKYISYIFENLHQFNYKYYHLFNQSRFHRYFWETSRLVYIMFINFPFSEKYTSKEIKSDLTGFIDHASKRMCLDNSDPMYLNRFIGKKTGFNYREHCGMDRQVKDFGNNDSYPIALLSSSIVEYFRDKESKKDILKTIFGLPIGDDYETGRINFMSIMDIFNEFLDFFTNIKNDYQRKIGFIEYPYPSEEFKTVIQLEASPDIKKKLLSYQNISKYYKFITQTLSEDELHEETKKMVPFEYYWLPMISSKGDLEKWTKFPTLNDLDMDSGPVWREKLLTCIQDNHYIPPLNSVYKKIIDSYEAKSYLWCTFVVLNKNKVDQSGDQGIVTYAPLSLASMGFTGVGSQRLELTTLSDINVYNEEKENIIVEDNINEIRRDLIQKQDQKCERYSTIYQGLVPVMITKININPSSSAVGQGSAMESSVSSTEILKVSVYDGNKTEDEVIKIITNFEKEANFSKSKIKFTDELYFSEKKKNFYCDQELSREIFDSGITEIEVQNKGLSRCEKNRTGDIKLKPGLGYTLQEEAPNEKIKYMYKLITIKSNEKSQSIQKISKETLDSETNGVLVISGIGTGGGTPEGGIKTFKPLLYSKKRKKTKPSLKIKYLQPPKIHTLKKRKKRITKANHSTAKRK